MTNESPPLELGLKLKVGFLLVGPNLADDKLDEESAKLSSSYFSPQIE